MKTNDTFSPDPLRSPRFSVRRLTMGAMVGALYAGLTMALPVLSYGPVQLRFAEALTVLPYLFAPAVPGLFVGCAAANLLSQYGLVDVIVGSLATLLAGVLTAKLRSRFLAPLPPVLCNAVLVGAEIAWFEGGFSAAFFPAWAWNALTVGAGELLACYALGLPLLHFLCRIPALRPYFRADRRG